MSIKISDIVHSVRKSSTSLGAPVKLGHAQQLIAALLGYKSLASYQAAQGADQEPQYLDEAHHVVADSDMVDRQCAFLNNATSRGRLGRS